MDTDSVSSNTKVITGGRHEGIEKVFLNNIRDEGDIHYIDNSEYIFPKGVTALTFDGNEDREMEVDYIYRHKVEKAMYVIEDEFGNEVTVTEDHSVMVERDGVLMDVKPTQIQEDDILYSV